MKCNNCGQENTGDKQFCINCGAPLNYQQNQFGQPNNRQPDVQHPYGGQPGYNMMPNPDIKQREIALCIIFTIITCGIYGMYWLIKLADETNIMVNDNGVSNGENLTSGGMVFLFSLITCNIYGFYWAYKQGERIDRIRVAKGLPQSNLHTTYLIVSLAVTLTTGLIFGLGTLVVLAMSQSELNNLNK